MTRSTIGYPKLGREPNHGSNEELRDDEDAIDALAIAWSYIAPKKLTVTNKRWRQIRLTGGKQALSAHRIDYFKN